MSEKLKHHSLHTKVLLNTSIVGIALAASGLISERNTDTDSAHLNASPIPECATDRFPLPEKAKVGTSLTLKNGEIVVINEKPVIDFINTEKPPVGVVYGTSKNGDLDVSSVTADCDYAGGRYTANPIELP